MTAACENPIFIVGTPRSGTTLTATLLGNHPDVFMPGECHYFEVIANGDVNEPLGESAKRQAVADLMNVYGLYNQPEDQAAVDELFADAAKRRRLEEATSFADLFRCFMQLRMCDSGAKRWGNQAPKDIFHFDKIRQAFPNAHFVICVRDCRDFLLSYKGRWKVSEHSERLHKLYHPVLTALLWRSTMKAAQRLRSSVPEENVSVVRYEDLVSKPNETLSALCGELGISYSEDMTSGVGHNSSASDQPEGIFSTSVGRWKSGLSPAETCVAQQINATTMTAYGYPLEETSTLTWSVLRCWLSFPFRAVSALYANRAQRGSLLPYLLKRLK